MRALVVWVALAVLVLAAASCGPSGGGDTGSACSLTASKRQRKVMSAKR